MNIDILWDKIKILCKKQGVSQKEVSANLGWLPRHLESLIANKRIPSIEEIYLLSTYFQIPYQELLEGVFESENSLENVENRELLYKNKLKEIKDCLEGLEL